MSDGVAVRIRGIYSTAITRRLLASDQQVVQPSDPINDRFETTLPVKPADVDVSGTGDRLGVLATGDSEAVTTVQEILSVVDIDTLSWTDPTPLSAVFDAQVTETLGSGAVVNLGEREGFLPYQAVDEHVTVGDAVRVQVHDPAAGWSDDRPLVRSSRIAGGPLVRLRDDLDDTVVDAPAETAREVAGMVDLLDVDVPPSWGVEWNEAAADADLDHLNRALERSVQIATDLIGLPESVDPPRRLAAPTATAWIWFGRTSRFTLDGDRAHVTPTMPGHHRVKAESDRAGDAVDFLEAVCSEATVSVDADVAVSAAADDSDQSPDESDRMSRGLDTDRWGSLGFPYQATKAQFGPQTGSQVVLAHGKPDGSLYVLGRAEVIEHESNGAVTVRREASGRGTYDALGTDREPGDVAVTRLQEGRWWYATRYTGADGTQKGTYANVCTPVEVFPETIRYVDLHVDVVEYPDGTVERVDDDELTAAVAADHVSENLAERARAVAGQLERALGD